MEGYAGDLGWDDVHDHARSQRRQPARDVQADAADRNHPSAYHCAGRHADLAATVTKLGLTDAAPALDRRREGLPQVRLEPCSSGLQCGHRHPERVRKHAIETDRVVSQCSHSATRNIFTDRPNDLGRGGHIEISPGHNGGVVEPLAGRAPAAKIDHPKHGAILRPRRPAPTPIINGRSGSAISISSVGAPPSC